MWKGCCADKAENFSGGERAANRRGVVLLFAGGGAVSFDVNLTVPSGARSDRYREAVSAFQKVSTKSEQAHYESECGCKGYLIEGFPGVGFKSAPVG